MKTNRSPLNQQDQDSHEFDHKPAKSDIKMAEIANAKMKKLKDKSFDHQFNKNEKLNEVVIKAPKNYSQIKNKDGSQLMTANEAKITDETGFKPSSVKDKEFRGGPNRKSALNMLGVSSPLNACWKTGGPGNQGYVQRGMKKKGNRTVPNCVPKASVKK